jgi:hypothetical protein
MDKINGFRFSLGASPKKRCLEPGLPRFARWILWVALLSSCQSARMPAKSLDESAEDVQRAVGAVAGALGGKAMSEEEVKRLAHDLRTDENAKTAVKSITAAMDPQQPGRVKYSPATGKRYAPHLEYDPETGVKLEYVK